MNGSSRQDPVLPIENVEYVENGEKRPRRKKKDSRSKSGSDDQVLISQLPLYDGGQEEERNPLLGTSSMGGQTSGYASPHSTSYPYAGQQQAHFGYGDYGPYLGHQPPPPSPPYPPMTNIPNQMYQYYDQMGASIYPSPQQQMMTSSPHVHPSYNDQHHNVRSPPGKQQHSKRISPASSPPPQQIRKTYPDVAAEGAVHPLKRSSRVATDAKQDAGRDYMIDINTGLRSSVMQDRGATSEQGYGSIPDTTTPPRSVRSRVAKPPAGRKADSSPLTGRPPSPLTRSHRRVSSEGKQPGQHHRTTSADRLRSMTDKDVAGGGGKHRRSSSDHIGSNGKDPTGRMHRRSSSDNRLPPKGCGSRPRKQTPASANRMRSYSGGPPAIGQTARPSHVRASSLSEVSVATSTSMVSHVTDISKSAFFVGTTETGKVQLHFPFENVRLTMDDALPSGTLFMRYVDEEQYEDYHILNDEHSVPWDLDDLHCHCTCAKCSGCTERNQQLGPAHYIMTVEDDVYRRVLDEISASRTMPCGLFFCGHHEDVSQPSIFIAMVIVSLFICALIVATVMTNA